MRLRAIAIFTAAVAACTDETIDLGAQPVSVDCTKGWVDVARADDLEGSSFAAESDGYAVTWNERQTEQRGYLGFFDHFGNPLGEKVEVAVSSRVISDGS